MGGIDETHLTPYVWYAHTHIYTQEFADGSVLAGVDLVLICTGYEYSMPFLRGGGSDSGSSPTNPQPNDKGGARLVRVEDRAVFPVYQHLFHARFPTLTFMGLLHSVVPFRTWWLCGLAGCVGRLNLH